MIPQYRIFFSWQSDNTEARDSLQQALDEVVKQLKGKGIAVQIEQGGGGCGFISIEDSVRIKIRRCDIFVGDVTPVGNVAMKKGDGGQVPVPMLISNKLRGNDLVSTKKGPSRKGEGDGGQVPVPMLISNKLHGDNLVSTKKVPAE